MIYYLNGVLAHKELGFAVIDCNGIGYKVSVSFSTYNTLPELGKQIKLNTYLHIREDAFELFGFCDLEEQNCFKLLIGISGVGPKLALAVLSEMNAQKFAISIVTGDHKAFTKANGVGAKMAQRIILELKDKIQKESFLGLAEFGNDELVNRKDGDAVSEAISALMVLGYTQGEAIQALKKVDTEGVAVEVIIKNSLKQLMKM